MPDDDPIPELRWMLCRLEGLLTRSAMLRIEQQDVLLQAEHLLEEIRSASERSGADAD
jgi:hypothetical protein